MTFPISLKAPPPQVMSGNWEKRWLEHPGQP